jgi:YD repeat-containing protein
LYLILARGIDSRYRSFDTTNYTYDTAGRLTGITNPNGTSSALTYDNADRLTRITHSRGMTNLEDIQYLVNAVGNRTQMTDSAGVTTWTYDNLDRLTNVSYPNSDTTIYGYDKAGNRTSHTVNGVAKTNTFDNANRMTASGTDTYAYDANGNQTGKTSGGVTTTYTYDALDRLTGISGPVTASYAHNLPSVSAERNDAVWCFQTASFNLVSCPDQMTSENALLVAVEALDAGVVDPGLVPRRLRVADRCRA